MAGAAAHARCSSASRSATPSALVQPERRDAGTLVVAQPPPPDPLSGEEWWRAAIGIADLTPPGPGIPVTVVDSGIDVTHPEFAGRPNTETLNPQEPAPVGGEHGTAVASLVGAPANGQGIVGVYPKAVLRSWDSARGAGTRLETVEIVNGILEASRRGRGVINLSLGGTERDPLIEQAVAQAVARGSLVVAASGNDGQAGSPLGYPAVLPHVLTVAATNRSDQVASLLQPLRLRRPRCAGCRHHGRHHARRWLAGELRHELRGAARLRGGSVGLDGSA